MTFTNLVDVLPIQTKARKHAGKLINIGTQ